MRHFLMIAFIFIGCNLKGQNQFNPEWIKFFGSTFALDQASAQISLDDEENIFFAFSGYDSVFIDTLWSTDAAFSQCSLIGKLDASGSLLWSNSYQIPGEGCARVHIQNHVVTPDGGAILAGYYYGTVNYDGYYISDDPSAQATFFLHKINAAGEHVALIKFDSLYLRDMVVSKNGDITVSAFNYAINPNTILDSTIITKYLIFQLDSTLALDFILEQNIVLDYDYYQAKYFHLATDTVGNTYVGYAFDHNSVIDGINYTGYSYTVTITDSSEVWEGDSMYYEYYTYDEVMYNVDGLLAKYDDDGNMLWHALLQGNSHQLFYSIACEGSDEVYALATTMTVPGDFSYLNDSSLLIPTAYSDYPFTQSVLLKFNATGTAVDYIHIEQNVDKISKCILENDRLYVCGENRKSYLSLGSPALWSFDTTFAALQYAEASCPDYLDCASMGSVIDVDAQDSAIYIVGLTYSTVYLDGQLYAMPHVPDLYFIAKLPLEYGVPHVIPDSVQFINAEINVFPNPVSNILHIATNLPDGEITACYIANTLGQHWPFVPEQINLNMWQVDVHMLRRGAYVIYYEINENMHAATFVKM